MSKPCEQIIFDTGDKFEKQTLDEISKTYSYLTLRLDTMGDYRFKFVMDHLKDKSLNILFESGVDALRKESKRQGNFSEKFAYEIPAWELEGYDWLIRQYVKFLQAAGDLPWGYIEINQGVGKNRTEMRNRIKKFGLNPIPHFNPLFEDWADLKRLMRTYPKVAVEWPKIKYEFTGVFIEKLNAEIRDKPDCWIHLMNAPIRADLTSCKAHSLSLLPAYKRMPYMLYSGLEAVGTVAPDCKDLVMDNLDISTDVHRGRVAFGYNGVSEAWQNMRIDIDSVCNRSL